MTGVDVDRSGWVKPAHLHPFARPAAKHFDVIVAGDGAIVRDAAGRNYVDAMASLWYCNVGHGRRTIADAAAAQMQRLAGFHTFERFANEPSEQLAQDLSSIAPMPGARVFFTTGGSEAVDSAVKIARAAHSIAGEPQRTLLISRAPSYHGVTYGGLALTGLPPNQQHFGPMLGDVIQTPKDDLERVREIFTQRGDDVAAVIAEPVIGAGGVFPPAPGYLEGLRGLCDDYGAFLILDEVICGFGRLGRWWGAQRFGVQPDLLTFAKGVTSGYLPLGGVLVGASVRQRLEADEAFVLRHGHTYSGHPTSCAAALANLQILRDESLVDRAVDVGQRLADGLRPFAASGRVAELRGDGAVWAVGLHPDQSAAALRDAMLDEGVIVRPIGTDTVSFCPPLVINDNELARCFEALEQGLDKISGGR